MSPVATRSGFNLISTQIQGPNHFGFWPKIKGCSSHCSPKLTPGHGVQPPEMITLPRSCTGIITVCVRSVGMSAAAGLSLI
jgi:hypothetical protein